MRRVNFLAAGSTLRCFNARHLFLFELLGLLPRSAVLCCRQYMANSNLPKKPLPIRRAFTQGIVPSPKSPTHMDGPRLEAVFAFYNTGRPPVKCYRLRMTSFITDMSMLVLLLFFTEFSLSAWVKSDDVRLDCEPVPTHALLLDRCYFFLTRRF